MRKECVFSYFLLSESGTNYLCSHVLAGIINRFSSQYPGVEVELVEAKSQSLLDAVRADALDIVVDSFDSLPEGLLFIRRVGENIRNGTVESGADAI